jgi:hypothetical protein
VTSTKVSLVLPATSVAVATMCSTGPGPRGTVAWNESPWTTAGVVPTTTVTAESSWTSPRTSMVAPAVAAPFGGWVIAIVGGRESSFKAREAVPTWSRRSFAVTVTVFSPSARVTTHVKALPVTVAGTIGPPTWQVTVVIGSLSENVPLTVTAGVEW